MPSDAASIAHNFAEAEKVPGLVARIVELEHVVETYDFRNRELEAEVERLREQGGLYVEALDDKDAEVERLRALLKETQRALAAAQQVAIIENPMGRIAELEEAVERLRAAVNLYLTNLDWDRAHPFVYQEQVKNAEYDLRQALSHESSE